MIEFEKGSIIAFSNIYPNTTITGYLFYMEENIYHKITDIREIFFHEAEAKFNTKIKCITVLTFLPFSDFIDDDDLPQNLVSFFETHYIVVEGTESNPHIP